MGKIGYQKNPKPKYLFYENPPTCRRVREVSAFSFSWLSTRFRFRGFRRVCFCSAAASSGFISRSVSCRVSCRKGVEAPLLSPQKRPGGNPGGLGWGSGHFPGGRGLALKLYFLFLSFEKILESIFNRLCSPTWPQNPHEIDQKSDLKMPTIFDAILERFRVGFFVQLEPPKPN